MPLRNQTTLSLKAILHTAPEYFYVALIIIAFLLVVFIVPSIIYTSLKYNLFDHNDLHRKNHKRNISRLGGVAIVASFIVCMLVFTTVINFKEANFLIVSCIILSALGIKDDVYGTNTSTKLLLQLIVASILVFLGHFKLTSLYGVLGIQDMNLFWSGVFSIILIIFLNNSFNLIDGIDGLAGTIGIVASLVFGVLFAKMGAISYAFIAFALAGAIGGFLKYNWYPAKIFMGDTGALIIGLVCAALAIKFIELNKLSVNRNPAFFSAPAIAVSILIVPIFDSLRIFLMRILRGKSPFRGDRNHIHHRLQRLGLKPDKITFLMATLSVIMIALTVFLQNFGNFLLIFLLIGICVILDAILTLRLRKKQSIIKHYH